jgi:hypothetical protein
MSIYEPDNVSWETPDLPGWEPWEPDESDDKPAGGCGYCDATEVRENPEPFGGLPCCEACFNLLIGGSADDPPWRCGTASPTSDGRQEATNEE